MAEHRQPPRPPPAPPGTLILPPSESPLKEIEAAEQQGSEPLVAERRRPQPVAPPTTKIESAGFRRQQSEEERSPDLAAVELLSGKAQQAIHKAPDLRAVITLVDSSGRELSHHAIEPPATVIGRDEGDIQFPEDSKLSNPHARFHFKDGKLHVEDLGSTEGVFIRVRGPRPLLADDIFVVGRQILRLDSPVSGDRDGQMPILAVVASRGEVARRYPLTAAETVIGRAPTGNVVFASDEYVSGRHAVIRMTSGTPMLDDLDSRNGTHVKARGSVELQPGDQVILGEKRFQVSIEERDG